MKLFISWSGERSQQLAEVMSQWFRRVLLETIDVFVSTGLPPGDVWGQDLRSELETSDAGLAGC